MKIIEIYTKGMSDPSTGESAWAFIIFNGKKIIERSGYDTLASLRRMELIAIIESLNLLKDNENTLRIYASENIKEGLDKIKERWKRSWKTEYGKPIANSSYWRQLDRLIKNRHIEWKWVKGPNSALCETACFNAFKEKTGSSKEREEDNKSTTIL